MDKKISVIVPVYNSEKYLKQCVESVLIQTYSNIELILVDDGSTDSSSALCDDFAKYDARIKVFHQENMRIGAARNKGIEEATGDYLTFIDSDDFIENDTYEVCMQLIKKYDADLVQWDLTFVPELGCTDIIENHKKSNYTELVLDRDRTLNKLFEAKNMDVRFNHIWTATHCVWTKLYKKELFEGVRFPVGKEYEDEMILHKLLYKVHKAVFINCRFSNYRLRAGSTVHTMPLKGKVDKVDAMMDRHALMKSTNNRELIMGSVHDALIGIFNIYLCARRENNKEAKKLLTSYARQLLRDSSRYMKITDNVLAVMLCVCSPLFVLLYGGFRKTQEIKL